MPPVRPSRDSLAAVERDVVRCRRCPRLIDHCARVAREKRRAYLDWNYWGKPVPGFGDPGARLLILGLAPGAHGANRTGRMFTGDASGDWLYRALHTAGFADRPDSIHKDDGLRLNEAWISAAGRCAPPGNRPTAEELASCRPFLRREARLLPRVRLVVALGGIAYDTYLKLVREDGGEVPRPKPRFGHGALVKIPGAGFLRWPVLCSYHPSRQNTQTGRLTRDMLDGVFRRARALLAGSSR
jgi:uracil-DNA glycosylase family 4